MEIPSLHCIRAQTLHSAVSVQTAYTFVPPPQNPNKPVAKNHHQMVLRCENAADKYDWLARE